MVCEEPVPVAVPTFPDVPSDVTTTEPLDSAVKVRSGVVSLVGVVMDREPIDGAVVSTVTAMVSVAVFPAASVTVTVRV